MSDDLRAQIAQACFENSKRAWLKLNVNDQKSLLDLILPLVEQAIREEREKALREALTVGSMTRCVICGGPTDLRCSDCAIDSGGSHHIAICQNSACRDEHERLHAARQATKEALWKAEMALAGIEAGLRAEFANGGTYEGHDVISAFGEFIEHHAKVELALAEKDAQIAALQAELDDFRRGQARHLSKMRPAGQ